MSHEAIALADWIAGSIWRHVKTGKVYSVVGTCRLEATNSPAVLYASPDDGGVVWARDMDEFLDGRFERVDAREIADLKSRQ